MNIGFIGLGIMGEPMCKNLITKNADDSFFVYDIDEQKRKSFESLKAISCNSIAAVGESADIIFSMVPKSVHVKAVYNDLLEVIKPGQILVDMSSIEPSVSRELSQQVQRKGAIMLDCPVVKSKAAAEDGSLGIYCGGDKVTFEKIKLYLLCMGSNAIHLGENGNGTAMKAIHNMLVGQIQNGVNEMIYLAQKKGIDVDSFVKAISYGGAGNFYLNAKASAIKNDDYSTAFSIENMHKDVHIAKNLMQEEGMTFPGVENVVSVYDEAMAMSLGKEDFSASYKVIKKRNEA